MDTSELEESISSLKRDIKAVKVSISGLEDRIKRYDGLIAADGGGYDVDALKESNDHANGQISRLRQRISQLQTNIAEQRNIIEVLEIREKIAEGVTIDANTLN